MAGRVRGPRRPHPPGPLRRRRPGRRPAHPPRHLGRPAHHRVNCAGRGYGCRGRQQAAQPLLAPVARGHHRELCRVVTRSRLPPIPPGVPHPASLPGPPQRRPIRGRPDSCTCGSGPSSPSTEQLTAADCGDGPAPPSDAALPRSVTARPVSAGSRSMGRAATADPNAGLVRLVANCVTRTSRLSGITAATTPLPDPV